MATRVLIVEPEGRGSSRSLRERGIAARLVSLPEGHDPNSFFVQGADARQFQSLLEAAQP